MFKLNDQINVQILFKFQVNGMKIDNFRNPACVDLKNNSLVEFSDLKYKSSSKFKPMGWKLRILETSPKLLTFGLCWPFDLKNNWLLPDDKLHHVVKFLEDRFKIVTCRLFTIRRRAEHDTCKIQKTNLTYKNNWWLNFLTKYATPLQISSQSDENWRFQKSHLSCWPFDLCWPQK